MSTADETLTKLAREFVVRDIMASEEELVCSSDVSEALTRLDEYPDFDIIPIRREGCVTGFVERGSSTLSQIEIGDLVSESTSILDVVDILKNQRRAFVLVGNRIGGYVHFSDLNRPIVKLPFFVLLEAVERHFFNELAGVINSEMVKAIVDPQRFEILSRKMCRLESEESNLNWAAMLGFKDLLLCAQGQKLTNAETSEIDALSKIRNLVCHAATSDLLVENHDHVARLADAKTLCFKLLKSESPAQSNRKKSGSEQTSTLCAVQPSALDTSDNRR